MIVRALAENTSVSEVFETEHGLSLYIETKGHKLLFDLGASRLFIENAQKMGVNVSEADLAVISHGHYDHGGGLKDLLSFNCEAKIYMHRKAFGRHYASSPDGTKRYIGLDDSLSRHERIVFADERLVIDDELELFSDIKKTEPGYRSNKVLLVENDGLLAEDPFLHEQNLIITEDGKTLLVAGCAHNGIVDIVRRYIEIKDKPADVVIGGFHLSNPRTGACEDRETVRAVGRFLKETGSQYYTCHCTGLAAFEQLKEIMGDKIRYLATGGGLEI